MFSGTRDLRLPLLDAKEPPRPEERRERTLARLMSVGPASKPWLAMVDLLVGIQRAPR